MSPLHHHLPSASSLLRHPSPSPLASPLSISRDSFSLYLSLSLSIFLSLLPLSSSLALSPSLSLHTYTGTQIHGYTGEEGKGERMAIDTSVPLGWSRTITLSCGGPHFPGAMQTQELLAERAVLLRRPSKPAAPSIAHAVPAWPLRPHTPPLGRLWVQGATARHSLSTSASASLYSCSGRAIQRN